MSFLFGAIIYSGTGNQGRHFQQASSRVLGMHGLLGVALVMGAMMDMMKKQRAAYSSFCG